ncbi:MAG TPA: two-component system response regulator [Chloroflexi bacterium]|nr:two-component system response regulator [Chloroflexota bacterium]HBY07391.1 two-component system response regulator [Chloroflexota bacterium]
MARILFVDDDPLTLETYSTIISYFGHEVLLAANGGDALEVAVQESPDMMVLDMNMPDMHGFDLLRKLRKNPLTAHLPAVMVSASPEAFADGAIAAGAQEFRSKPVRPDDLLALIEKYTAANG